MSYAPLRLWARMPDRVFRFVRDGIEPSLFDVHSMLRLPIAGVCEANCAFSIVMVLLNAVSGASTLLHESTGGAGQRFVKCLELFYPWHFARFEDDVVGFAASHIMYDVFRNPFAHSFGLEITRPSTGMPVAKSRNVRKGVGRLQTPQTAAGIDEELLEELELAQKWPVWAGPTLEREPGGYKVNAEALYRGVRLMIERLCREPSQMAHASRFLAGG